MFVVQKTHSKTGLKRPDRPCDSCRRRKSRCVFSENDTVCFLCRFHNYECIFSESPAPRKRQRRNSNGNDANKDRDKDSQKEKDSKDKDELTNTLNVVSAVSGTTSPSAAADGIIGGATGSPGVPSMQSMSSVLSLGTDRKDPKVDPSTGKRVRNRALSRKTSSGNTPTGSSSANVTGNGVNVTAGDGSAAAAGTQSAGTPDSPFPDYDFLPHSLLRNTLGLQCRRYISYIGTSAEHDPILMDHYGFDSRDRASLPVVGPDFKTKRQVRRVQSNIQEETANSQISFVVFESEDLFKTGHPNPSGRDDTIGGNLVEVRKIQSIIGKFGRQLIGLYFSMMHPSLPILHKEEFLEKYYRNPYELSPSLLAGLYVFAINWWTYDPDLVPFPRPPQATLEALAQINLYREIDRPTLSTVQAGILLLQHQTFRNQVTRPSHSWAMLGEVIAIAQEVGLHMDPTQWSIPEWEIGLRKRLAWGLYIQDKWMALTFGRPSKIDKINWTVSDLTDENFPNEDNLSMSGNNPDDSDDEVIASTIDSHGSVNRETGKIMFLELVKLTKILSDILDEFHSARSMIELFSRFPTDDSSSSSTDKPSAGESDETENSDEIRIKKLLLRARPLQIRIKDWMENLPDCLKMENITLGELSANGNLHLGCHAAQIALFRPILRAFSHIDVSQSPMLEEIYDLVYRSALAELVAAVDFASSMRPQHIQTFWYAASKNNFAVIVTFGFLLLLTARTDAERQLCSDKIAEYQWTLKVNIRGAEFLQHAILWAEECKYLLKSELGKKNMKQQQSQQSQQMPQSMQTSGSQNHSNPSQLNNSQQVHPQMQDQAHLFHMVQNVAMQQYHHLQQQHLPADYLQQMSMSDISQYIGDNSLINDQAVILPSAHGPVLHNPGFLGQQNMHHNIQSMAADSTTSENNGDIFFSSLASGGRSHVISQHASNGIDELDNLEIFNMRMLSHPWIDTENLTADISLSPQRDQSDSPATPAVQSSSSGIVGKVVKATPKSGTATGKEGTNGT
ncbi:fungal-specific transcription factor domain-containing protein [Dipodascopsis uninucleata]